MPFPTFKTFFETTASDPNAFKAANGPDYNKSAGHVRASRINGTSNNPHMVAQSSINTQTATKNKIDKVANNHTSQEVLNDLDLQEIQNTNGINLSQMQNNVPEQVNAKIKRAAVVKTVDATGKPIYKLIHYKPIQQ